MRSLSDDEKDALYEQVTDSLINSVHLTTKTGLTRSLTPRQELTSAGISFPMNATEPKTIAYGGQALVCPDGQGFRITAVEPLAHVRAF